MSDPLVSVLMTAYNREKYIAEAIESVLAQTFTDFELIIVDDGSKDRTVEIAKRYASDARVRVHVNEKKLGQFPNRNRAAELARGKYFKYVDPDDVIYPHCLEVMVRCMERFPAAGFGLSQPPWPDGSKPYPLELSPHGAYRRHFLGSGFFGNAPLSSIIRASAFRNVGGFIEKPYACGDTEFWLILGARYPAVVIPSGLTWWRSHSDQATALELSNNAYLSQRYWMALDALGAPECPLANIERTEAVRRVKRAQARRVLRFLASGRLISALEVRKGSSLSLVDLLQSFSPAAKALTANQDEP